MSQPRQFAITPPDLRMPALLFAIVLVSPLAALALGWRELRGTPALWLLLATTLIAPTLLWLAVFRRKVMIDGDTLHIVAGLNQTRVALSALLPQQARIIDLDTRPENRLGFKRFGTSMPGYHAGHFSQIGGNKVFALVTGKHGVLVLPERDGRLLMLSMEKPQAMLDAIERIPR